MHTKFQQGLASAMSGQRTAKIVFSKDPTNRAFVMLGCPGQTVYMYWPKRAFVKLVRVNGSHTFGNSAAAFWLEIN